MYLYLQLLCLFVIAPNIALLYLNRKRIHGKSLGIALLVLFLIAVIWDQLSVRMGLWTFSQDEIIGNLLGLPIEEYLFFLFVPLISINIYLLIEGIRSRKKRWTGSNHEQT
jgi:lycopene cyclase domain-containing protein